MRPSPKSLTRRPINSAAEPHGRTAAGSLDQNNSVRRTVPKSGLNRAAASAPDSTSQVSNRLAVLAELSVADLRLECALASLRRLNPFAPTFSISLAAAATIAAFVRRARARIAWLAGILIAALISTMEAAERKSGSSWVSNPVSKAVRSPLARRQAFEQSSVNQPTCHRHFPCLMLAKIDIKVMRKSQEEPA